MSQFVQVLRPAAVGEGMTLDVQTLRQMLCSEQVKNLPVVVLAAVGPRGSGKTTLLTAVQRAITGSRTPSNPQESRTLSNPLGSGPLPDPLGSGPLSDPLGSGPPSAALSRAACEADLAGSAGAAVWPDLLPVTLQTGQRAALLLLDTWGPFDDACSAQQRDAVLLLSAVLSSLLVVQMSGRSPVCSLGDLLQLGKLGAAAQDVRHCTALQELVLLMRDCSPPAPLGRQDNFAPLYGWAQSEPAAGQALGMMEEAAEWYSEGDAALFLTPDHSAGGGGGAADPVALLAAPRAAKRFDDEVEMVAGELADYVQHLAAALSAASCDAASMLHALVEANQSMAARAAEPVYMKSMERMWRNWQSGSMSEPELRGAHDRAAHDALMSFTMSRKLDSETMDSDKLRNEFLDRLKEKYNSDWEKMSADTKKHDDDALERGEICKQTYNTSMEDALHDSPRMTMAELIKHHDTFRLQLMSQFDSNNGSLGHSRTQQRMDLSDELEALFRKFANQLDQGKEEAEMADAKKSIIKSAETGAKQLYCAIMEAVKPDKLQEIHSRVQGCATLQFDSKTKDMPEEHTAAARARLVDGINATFQTLTRPVSSSAGSSYPSAGSSGTTRPGSYNEGGRPQHAGSSQMPGNNIEPSKGWMSSMLSPFTSSRSARDVQRYSSSSSQMHK